MKLTDGDVARVCQLVADLRISRATLLLVALALLLTHDQKEVLE